jgi:hypothetical protein
MKPMQLILRPFLLLLVAAVAASTRAPAQTTTFLIPDRYELVGGGEVAVHAANRGPDGLRTIAWPGSDLEWLYSRSAGTQTNLPATTSARSGEQFVRIALAEPDAALVGFDRRPWIEQVPATDLRKFLELDVAASALPADWTTRITGETVRVRRVESAKLVVRMTRGTSEGKEKEKEDVHGSATAPSKVGQRTEIRPLVDPTAMAVGSDLPLRISWADPSSVDATIVARQPGTETRIAVLSRKGSGWFTVSAPGEWLVEVHRAKPLTGDSAADWELETATLSFVVPAPAKPAGGGK